MLSKFKAKLPTSIRHYAKLLFKKKYKESYREQETREKELERLKHLPRYQPTKTSLFGKEVELVDAHTFLSGCREIFEQEIYAFESYTDTPYIIDCGANIGLSTIFFKRMYPDADVVAFEPDPTIYSCLRSNLQSFGFRDVNLYQAAVWNANTEIDFQVEGAYSGRIAIPGDSGDIIQVKAKRLRDFIDRRVDFLKMDIEGAEYEVIQDCCDLLRNVENIFIEYHSHETEDQKLHKLLSILYKSGFRYHIHEAWTSPQPFMDCRKLLGMDLQLNIYGFRL